MSALILLVPAAVLLGLFFLVAFIVSAKRGQFDDLETPAYRVLTSDSETKGAK